MTRQEREKKYSRIRAEKRAAAVLASDPKLCEWCKETIPVEKLLVRSTLKYCGKKCNDAAAKHAMQQRLAGKRTDAEIDAIAAAVWARKATPDAGRQARSPLCVRERQEQLEEDVRRTFRKKVVPMRKKAG